MLGAVCIDEVPLVPTESAEPKAAYYYQGRYQVGHSLLALDELRACVKVQ